MTQYRRSVRWFLVCFSMLALLVAGCHKKPAPAPAPPPPPPPAPAAPTASLSADRTSINKGESVKLSWTTTNATNVSISPEVGAVTPQGSTSVSPATSTTYTLSASGEGGNATSTVSISVTQPAPPPVHVPTMGELWDKEVHDAFFDYDKSDIRPDAQQALQQTANFLKGYPNALVTIEGYCDERGSTEYNLALGQRRANAVKEYLVNLGIPAGNLSTTSFGKEKQFCTEHNETCWQQNRRGHIVPTK